MMGTQGTAAESGVLALIELMADPKRYEARLAELRAAADEAEREQAQARVDKKALEETKCQADNAIKQSAEADKRALESCARAEKLMLEIQEREAAVAAREAAANRSDAALSKAKAALDAKAAALAERGEQLAMLENETAALKAEYEQKIEKLRAVVA